MYRISKDIIESVNGKVKIKEVSKDKCIRILKQINELYVDKKKKGIYLWERLNNFESLSDSKGWACIQNYVLNDGCIMLFNQDEENKMFEISNGKDLQIILSETCGFEFYITDNQCSYLICFNHHDILYGCGEAINWINSLKNNINKE